MRFCKACVVSLGASGLMQSAGFECLLGRAAWRAVRQLQLSSLTECLLRCVTPAGLVSLLAQHLFEDLRGHGECWNPHLH